MSVDLNRTLTAPGAELSSRQPLPGAAALPRPAAEEARGSFGVLPHVRGIVPEDPSTMLPSAGNGDAGARFVLAKPADLPLQPIRVYASLKSAPTMEARIDLAMRELDRQGAFARANIFVGVATGGGHVNPVTLELVERMAKGNVASVAVQYGTRPSVLSIDKVDDARDLTSHLLSRIRDRIRTEHPAGGGPRVLLYGESLGGWASQSALDRAADQAEKSGGGPADPLKALGVDRAAWIGIPGFSRFKAERLGPGGLQAINGIAELSKVPAEQRARARAWDLSHLDDPVHRADVSLLWRRPKWLPKDGPNPERVDPNQTFKPVLTFVNTAMMALKSANKDKPGVHTDHGHDYRKELPALLREAYGFSDVSDAELARMTEQVRQSEVWIMQQEWK